MIEITFTPEDPPHTLGWAYKASGKGGITLEEEK